MKTYTLLFFLILPNATIAQFSELFQREADYHHFNGAAMIHTADTSIQIFHGYAGNSVSELISANTTFDIGSLSKQFTAAAILHLVHDGRLELHQPINRYLGELGSTKWNDVTVHHLLTHTSGIPSIYQTEQGLDIFFPELEPISSQQLISRFKDAKLLHKPGKEFNYSNSGYVLLALIIEQISDTSYFEFMEDTIFKHYALEMTSTYPDSSSALPFFGYLPENLIKAPVYHPSWMKGAGGFYSSVSDLSKWVKIIQSHDFLTSELRELFFTNHTKDISSNWYAYGWQLTRDNRIEHDGGSYGFMSFLSFHPDENNHHIILTNRSFESINDFGKSASKIRTLSIQVTDLLNDKEVELHPERSRHTIEEKRIELQNGDIISISQNDNRYFVQSDKIPVTDLIYETPVEPVSQRNIDVLAISKHLEKNQFWKFASYCDGEMKLVTYTGLFRFGFSQIKKKAGENRTITPYLTGENYALLRMKGDKGAVNLIVYFNDEGKVSGFFDQEFYPFTDKRSFVAYAVDTNTLFVDGFLDGQESIIIRINEQNIQAEQHGRNVTLPMK
jgi:CubicO group peptidase (beta-lactamase class C family)